MNKYIHCTCSLTEKTLQGTLADLVTVFILPMARSVAYGIDQSLLEEAYKGLVASSEVHRLPSLTIENAREVLKQAGTILDSVKASKRDRHLLNTSWGETACLKAGLSSVEMPDSSWLTDACTDMLWHRGALILASRPTFTFEKLTTLITLSSNICLRVTLIPQKDSQAYTLIVETHLGVTTPNPDFAVIMGDAL